MIEIRPFDTLGHANHGWLDAHHHFSFADYDDPARTGWGQIRVWNDDVIAPKAGFPPHPHADMEIITYIREGAITHRDSLGNEGRTEAGDVQVMSAGSGIRHSEYNFEDVETRLFQIWIKTDERGVAPGWGTRPFPRDARAGKFTVLASGVSEDLADDGDALPIHAASRVLGATLKAGESVSYPLGAANYGYLVAASGAVEIEGQRAGARDGVAISGVETLTVTALEDSELVLVQTP